MYVTPEHISKGILMQKGVLRFGVLIIPDIYQGSEGVIANALKPSWGNINDFVRNGGLVYASNKGALVLQRLSLFDIGQNTFLPNTLYGSREGYTYTSGCESYVKEPSDSVDDETWMKATLCCGIRANENGKYRSSLISGPIFNNLGSFKPISSLSPDAETTIYKLNTITGETNKMQDDEIKKIVAVAAAQKGKGFVVIDTTNPTLYSDTYPWLYNALFLANSRPLIINTEIESKFDYFPALERFTLPISVTVQNLYNTKLTGFVLKLWIAKGVSYEKQENILQINMDEEPPTDYGLEKGYYLTYQNDQNELEEYEKRSFTINLKIEDITITQKGKGIVLAYPVCTYIDKTRNDIEVNTDNGPISINTYMPANMRCELNVDPIGVYPLPGSGSYHDNIFTAENKEDTEALNVKAVEVVPLISPLFDGSNSKRLSYRLSIDYKYYLREFNNVDDYKYPFDHFTEPRDLDYIDYSFISQHNDIIVYDYDTETIQFTKYRNSTFPTIEDNENTSTNNIPQHQSKITEQKYFPDYRTFYSLGQPRMLAFINPADEKSFKWYNDERTFKKFGGKPESWMITEDGKRMKAELLFVRVDPFFL